MVASEIVVAQTDDGWTVLTVTFEAAVEVDAAIVAALQVIISSGRDRGIDLARTLDPSTCALCGQDLDD